MKAKTSFDTLRISQDASLDEAKESYRRLVKLWHPDQYGNFPEKQMIAQEKLKEINVAYRDIIARSRRNPAGTTASWDGEDIERQHEKSPPVPKKERTTFWKQVALFIKTNILKSTRPEDPEKNDPLHSGTTRPQDTAFAGAGGGIAPDFQQILKRAVHERRLGVPRQHRGSRKRIHGKSGRAQPYRVETHTKNSSRDRVEKITPVGRVDRISGD